MSLKVVKYKIEFDREICIGALACNAVAENFWPRTDDGKVDLANATYNEHTKKWELIIEEKDFEINKDSADVCPVEAIVITKLHENEATNKESTIGKNQNDSNIQNKEQLQTTIHNNSNNKTNN